MGKQHRTAPANAGSSHPAGGPAPSSTPDQDTFGNAALASWLRGAGGTATSMPTQEDGSLDLGSLGHEGLIQMRSPMFFATEATLEEQLRMLAGASDGQVEEMLYDTPMSKIRRLLGAGLSRADQLRILRARPTAVRGVPDEQLPALMFGGGAESLVDYLQPPQLAVLVDAESGRHRKLVELLASNGDALMEAMRDMSYDDCIEVFLEMRTRNIGPLTVVTNPWGRAEVARYLDAAEHYGLPEVFDQFEALLVELGLGPEVEAWYAAREAAGPGAP